MKVILERFNSIEEFTRKIMSRKPNKVFDGCELSSETGSYNFTKTNSLSEAVELMVKGYDEPLKQLKNELCCSKIKIKSNTNAQRNRASISVAGYVPCVPNAIMGLPKSMITTTRIPMKTKIITILYATGANSRVSASKLIKAGTVVVNIVNLLERQGYRVKLEAEVLGAKEKDEYAGAIVNLKDWRTHLDIKKLTFPLAHPSCLRRLGFRWLETVEGITDYAWTWGYGKPLNNEKYSEAKRLCKEYGIIKENTYYLNPTMIIDTGFSIKDVMAHSGMAELIK